MSLDNIWGIVFTQETDSFPVHTGNRQETQILNTKESLCWGRAAVLENNEEIYKAGPEIE